MTQHPAWKERVEARFVALQAEDGLARNWIWLAFRSGISPDRLRNVRNGACKGKVQRSEATSIAEVLGRPVLDIFTPEEIVPDGQNGSGYRGGVRPAPIQRTA